MMYYKDLVNLRFGMLLVLEKVEKPSYSKSKNRNCYWKCLCDCGNEKIVASPELFRGDTKSCGCQKHKINFKGYGEIPKSVYTGIKNWSAASRNIEFNLTIEYLWELFLFQERKCVYSGEILKLGTSRHDSTKTASLDRIDSSKGYIEGNVVWCHKKINMLKMDLKLDDFYKFCKSVSKYEKQSKAAVSSIISR